jgi:polar amino acid transport system substrate-binding protein
MKRLSAIVLLFSLLGMGSFALADTQWQNRKVILCAEDAGWPPFSFQKKTPDEAFHGFNADLLKLIFDKHGILYEVVIRPWKRCLSEGIMGDVSIVMDAAKNDEREEKYLLTEPVYSLTPVIFFAGSKSHLYADQVNAGDLQTLRSCGQKGYTYSNFGFENGRVELISEALPHVLDLAVLERCDIGLARKEVFLHELKSYDNARKLDYRPLSNAAKEPFYWMINRQLSYAAELKQLIDKEVAELYRAGKAQALLNGYLK